MADTERDRKLIRLSHNDAVLLFETYAACIIFGLIAVFHFINKYFTTDAKDTMSLLAAMSTGLIGSGVYYSRKLYTACINSYYTFIDKGVVSTPSEALQRIGSKSYFLMRPLFAVAFALVICSIWRFGVSASGEGAPKLSTGFLYISIFLGFISGFLAGRVLTSLEGIGVQRLEAILAHTDGK